MLPPFPGRTGGSLLHGRFSFACSPSSMAATIRCASRLPGQTNLRATRHHGRKTTSIPALPITTLPYTRAHFHVSLWLRSGHAGLISLRRKSSPDLSRFGSKLTYGGDGDLIAELTKGSRQHLGTLFLFSRTYFVALLDESHPFMQDLPNDATEPMSNGPDGGLIAEAGHQT